MCRMCLSNLQCRLYSKLPVVSGWSIGGCVVVSYLSVGPSYRYLSHKPAHTIEHLSGEANERHCGQSVGFQWTASGFHSFIAPLGRATPTQINLAVCLIIIQTPHAGRHPPTYPCRQTPQNYPCRQTPPNLPMPADTPQLTHAARHPPTYPCPQH